MKLECERCGTECSYDNGRFIDSSIEQPHDQRKCRTKPGCVWCPRCRKAVPDTNPCEHYRYYSYKPGESENHFINLILQDHRYGDFGRFKRKQKRIGTSAGNTRTKNSKCNVCGMNLDNLTESQQEKHAKKHREIKSMESFV